MDNEREFPKDEFPEDILKEPLKYLYLRRKRLFEINGEEDDRYGEDEQDSFALVYSPDRLETQFPLRQFNIVLPRWVKPSTSDYKNEYFSVKDLEEHLDPLKVALKDRILVKNYESYDKIGGLVENPIEEFTKALNIIVEYDDGVGGYRY